MSDAYGNVAGGSLKLKGGGSSKKKKKSKSSSSSKPKESITGDSGAAGGSGSGGGGSSGGRKKTEAERRFEEMQRERMAERVAKNAGITHKDRVHDFNSKLESLSEHHDIPRVGPG